jgi:hypothetical protein
MITNAKNQILAKLIQQLTTNNQQQKKIKKGKLTASHRSTNCFLLPSEPGKTRRELVVQSLPGAKVGKKVMSHESCPKGFHSGGRES